MTQELLTSPEFKAFPKLARLNRDMIITEKIDGTNACIGITQPDGRFADPKLGWLAARTKNGQLVWAQSRKRIITPGDDNFGFAAWVWEHAEALATLGPGYHYGEWWGSGIQRGYGLEKGEKRFSLFAVNRYTSEGDNRFDEHGARPSGDPLLESGVCAVPILRRHTFASSGVDLALTLLRRNGSRAAPGFMDPEGIVVYHTAARTSFKVTLGDDGHKGA